MPPVLDLLRTVTRSISDIVPRGALATEYWCTRYALLVWLATLVLLPFDLQRFDGGRSTTASLFEDPRDEIEAIEWHHLSTMDTIFRLATLYLRFSGDSCVVIAAYLMSRFLTRSDVRAAGKVQQFFEWSERSLQRALDVGTENVPIGVLLSICQTLRFGKRDDLLPHAERLLVLLREWDAAGRSVFSSSNTLVRKLCMKLVQRIGLVLLRPRNLLRDSALLGGRSLGKQLQTTSCSPSNPTAFSDARMVIQFDAAANAESGEHHVDVDMDVDIPEQLDEIIGIAVPVRLIELYSFLL